MLVLINVIHVLRSKTYEHDGSAISSILLMKFLFMRMRDSPVFLSVVVVKSGMVVAAEVTVKSL